MSDGILSYYDNGILANGLSSLFRGFVPGGYLSGCLLRCQCAGPDWLGELPRTSRWVA